MQVPDLRAAPDPQRWLVAAVLGLAWLVPLALYWLTACPTIGWTDASMHVLDVLELRTGIGATDHNLFTWIARAWLLLVPTEDPAYALNLLSGLFGALTVGAAALGVHRLTANPLAAGFAALALTFSHALWSQSTVVEVYTLNTALLAVASWLVAAWTQDRDPHRLYLASLCVGWGVANHVQMALVVPAFGALFALRSERASLGRREAAWMALMLFLGALPQLLEIEEAWTGYLRQATASDWARETWTAKWVALKRVALVASGVRFQDKLLSEGFWSGEAWMWRVHWWSLLALNFPSVALVLGIGGIVPFARDRRLRPAFVFWAVVTGLQAAWSSNYRVYDMDSFALPVWVSLAWPMGVAVDRVVRRGGRLATALAIASPTCLLPPLLYAWLGTVDSPRGWWSRNVARGVNLYDPEEYFANPNKRGYTAARDVAHAIADTLPADAHLWASHTKAGPPFRYLQRLGVRTDVELHGLSAWNFGADIPAMANAHDMRAALEDGHPVFIDSATGTERQVLATLWRQLDRGGPPVSELEDMPQPAFIAAFPVYELRSVPLVGMPDLRVLELVPR